MKLHPEDIRYWLGWFIAWLITVPPTWYLLYQIWKK